MAKTDARREPTGQSQTATQQPNDSIISKVKRFFHTIYKIVSSSLGLLIILMGYSFLGAAIFHALEGGHERTEKLNVTNALEHVLSSAWNATENDVNETEFNDIMREEIKVYEAALNQAFLQGVTSDVDKEVWDFWGAFLFCATVYTTIGYGHIAPATDAGRIVSIIYALIGIPLCLVVLGSLGKLFTRAIKFLWSFVRRFYFTGSCKKIRKTGSIPVQAVREKLAKPHDTSTLRAEDGEEVEIMEAFEVDDDFNLPPIIAIAVTVAYIFLGALMYKQWEEDWSYLEAFYFIFVSVSTIGFGDVLPAHPHYFLASSIYVLLGLALVAMVINVIMEAVDSYIHKAKDRVMSVGHKMGLNLSAGSVTAEEKESKSN